ncbi:MAG: 50S ribosomal protein L35 [Alphaproteobacteria bacterium]|nr:50S ribosomal protein L35 [Alphaproteobacteria bacterium]
MPKMKTKSSAKKRFKVTGSGKVKFKPAFTSHMMMNKPKSAKRKAKTPATMFKADGEKVVTYFMPNSGVRRKIDSKKSTYKSKKEFN